MEELDPAFPVAARRRFHLRRILAAGGMGRVWLARDREWDTEVAVKAASFPSAEIATRMRTEFRTFARIHHENVVRLYDLVGDDASCCYSMEYVDGVNFSVFVRGSLPPGEPLDPAGRGRLLHATWQLVDALEAIHAANIIHRDIKPDNVLVDGRGRVVVVDPGIASGGAVAETEPEGIVGTVAFMSPEQLGGGPQGPSSDWYAVGVLLYEALTGGPAFIGLPGQVILQKIEGKMPSFEALPAGDPWIAPLTGLLRHDPAARGGGLELLRTLSSPVGARAALVRPLPFVGRESELSRLTRAWDGARGGRLVVVAGGSGSGKSRLLEEWVERLRSARGAKVVMGRCDPRESVPFRGLDGLWNLLSPRRGGIAPGGNVPNPAGVPVSREGRERAFAELRQRLFATSAQRPVVIVLDDAQWANPDTLALLAELARPPVPPEVFFLVGARDAAEVDLALGPSVSDHLYLGSLDADDARSLAQLVSPDRAEAIATASGGHPLLLAELCRAGRSAPETDLRSVVAARLAELPPDVRRVFELVALAGAALGTAELRRAKVADPLSTVSTLVAERLLRLEPGEGGIRVLPAHDSLAEACLAGLDAGAKEERHRVLAELLEAAGDERHELVATHLELGGRREAAALRYVASARESVRAYAYRAASAAYDRAFELDPTVADRATRIAHGDILAALGLGHRAADAFLLAGGGQTGDAPLRLRAAEQYMLSSRIPVGMRLLDGVLRELGVAAPKSQPMLLGAIAWAHIRLTMGWLPPAPEPHRLQSLWVAASTLSPFEPFLSHWYGALYALGARALGEPSSLSRSAGLEAILLARFRGTWFGRAAPARAREALRRAGRSQDPGDMAYAYVAEATVHWSVCEAQAAIAASEEALRRYDGLASATSHWEANIARLWLFGMYKIADADDKLMALADEVERDAAEREDSWGLDAGLFWAVARGHLIRGRVGRAKAAIDAVLARSAEGARNVGEVLADVAIADTRLVMGDLAAAWTAVLDGVPRRAHHGAEIIPAIGLDYYYRRATLAAAVVARAAPIPPDSVKAAQRYAKGDPGRIARLGGKPYGAALAELARLHGEALGPVGGDFSERCAALAARFVADGKPFWARLCRVLPAAARGEVDRSWRRGLYVDLYLPGLVKAEPPASE